MIQRDKEILKQLETFGVMTREHIIKMNFSNQKQPVVSCNRVMRRLADRGYVRVNKNVTPYEYFHGESKLRHDSTKIFHFKAIADFVVQAKEKGQLSFYEVEPFLGEKGTVEPDLFMIWNNIPLFVEIQRFQQSNKFIQDKINKYEAFFHSGEWKTLHWQRTKPVFPSVLVVSERPYKVSPTPFHVLQSRNIEDFIAKYIKRGNQ